MLDSSTYLLETARSLVLNPKDPPTWSILAGHSRTVSDSIKSLITSIRWIEIPLSLAAKRPVVRSGATMTLRLYFTSSSSSCCSESQTR